MEEQDAVRWCVVANVAPLTSHGPGGAEVRAGLKHFSPGTKLWLVEPLWGSGGDQVEVLGRHRGARGLVRMIVQRRHLTDFRVQGVHSPAVREHLGSAWPTKEKAEEIARGWNRISDAQTGVRYQARRIEVVHALDVIGQTTDPPRFNHALTYRIGWMLRDDILGDPGSTIGTLLRDHAEAEVIHRLLDLARAIPAESDTDYVRHPHWPRVAAAAREAAATLTQPQHDREGTP
ncbi:hypothetical protein ALI144C_23010 [Actinosynnema sp. ALI-1.44]|uniref:SCO4402 family protein n=1 Tax=Actinosynnema sp. ALI-1.44 TaxID=1933779 RepID=UPI00097BB895|nr:hypothetical protein [Actinosynnema sp. ALI-1.44]ONI79646.1 hypothetical protein ALI144C_23010 [Actinosynnema sp. ALI-1.44]